MREGKGLELRMAIVRPPTIVWLILLLTTRAFSGRASVFIVSCLMNKCGNDMSQHHLFFHLYYFLHLPSGPQPHIGGSSSSDGAIDERPLLIASRVLKLLRGVSALGASAASVANGVTQVCSCVGGKTVSENQDQ